ncbi:MAG: hypothetical protein WB392_06350 [Methanotrichaceae archaeon]
MAQEQEYEDVPHTQEQVEQARALVRLQFEVLGEDWDEWWTERLKEVAEFN